MQYKVHDPSDGEASSPAATPCCKWNDIYIRQHWSGRLKLLEIIGALVTGASLNPEDTAIRFTFLRVVAWIAFAIAVIDLFLHLFSMWERVHIIFRAPEALMAFAALTGFLFLLGAGLLADVAPRSRHYGATTLAVVAGFFAATFYGVETLLHFLTFRQQDPKFPPVTDFSVVM